MKKDELIAELRAHGVEERVLKAIEKVPREDFVLSEDKEHAYSNHPLPIHEGQTISQPLTVALMTQWLDVRAGDSVLEVGTGSGYQAAVLAELVGHNGKIITFEVRKKLYEFARKNLKAYWNIEVAHSNASKECDGEFDRIIVTASASKMPEKLLEHLKDNGKAVIPICDEMWLIRKKNGLHREMMGYFSFVPLVE